MKDEEHVHQWGPNYQDGYGGTFRRCVVSWCNQEQMMVSNMDDRKVWIDHKPSKFFNRFAKTSMDSVNEYPTACINCSSSRKACETCVWFKVAWIKVESL